MNGPALIGPALIGGVGLCSTTLTGLAALGGLPETAAATATPAATALFPPASRRRAGALTRLLLEAYAQAHAQAQTDATARATGPTVFGSAWGETETLYELLDQLAEGAEALSPLRFAGSVHNAASGFVSIATGNRGFTTSVSAGDDTFAMALLEALLLLDEGAPEVTVIVGDLDPPVMLAAPAEHCESLAVAVHLHRGAGRPALGLITAPIRPERGVSPTVTAQGLPPELAANPNAGALTLLRALARGQSGLVSLASCHRGDWALCLECA